MAGVFSVRCQIPDHVYVAFRVILPEMKQCGFMVVDQYSDKLLKKRYFSECDQILFFHRNIKHIICTAEVTHISLFSIDRNIGSICANLLLIQQPFFNAFTLPGRCTEQFFKSVEYASLR